MKLDKLLIKTLRSAERIVFFTGAGCSTESGIPTFRNADTGFWNNFDVETYATLEGFRRNPRLVNDWYQSRRQQIETLQPNQAHRVISDWQSKADITVITQNIDGFHQRAGNSHVIEIHGNINKHKCLDNGHAVDLDRLTNQEHQQCPECNSLIRPDVIWFGEQLPEEAFDSAEMFSYNADVFFAIGCSMEVQPAASLPINAKKCGSVLVQVNTASTIMDEYADFNLIGRAGEVMPELWNSVFAPN